MTRLFDAPSSPFSRDVVPGFRDVHADRVVAVPGGVRRASTWLASPASVTCGDVVAVIITAVASAMDGAAEDLGRIDAVAGDGDHGRGMQKGSAAARDSLRQTAGSGAATVLGTAGQAWAAKAGGTSGVLWGAALNAVGEALGDQAEVIQPTDVARAMRAGLNAITVLSKAEVGDKTMLDALAPFVKALERLTAAHTALGPAWSEAAQIATAAANATSRLSPKSGRARPLAEKSRGTPDAGAISVALCLRTAAAVLRERAGDDDLRSVGVQDASSSARADLTPTPPAKDRWR